MVVVCGLVFSGRTGASGARGRSPSIRGSTEMKDILPSYAPALESRGIRINHELIRTLRFFDQVQREQEVHGHIGEIGIAKGAFFVPLAACCRDGETAFAIDVFDIAPNWNTYGGSASFAALRETVDACLPGSEIRYWPADSLTITGRDLLAETGGRFRLFSIDGAHSVHHTVNDLTIAGEILSAAGIVWLDDVRNWGWPGVIEGYSRYALLNAAPRLVPFFLYSNKLLLTTPDSQGLYLEKATELAHLYGRKAEISYRISEFFGYRVIGGN